MENELIHDGQSFNGAKTRGGYDIKTYDDGFGILWISRNSIGINGIVRATTFEDAYSICENEFFPEADENIIAVEQKKLFLDFPFHSRRKTNDY